MMRQRWTVFAVMGVMLATGACGSDPEPVESPTPVVTPDTAAARRARETLATRVHFDFDQSMIRGDQQTILTSQVAVLRAHPQVRLRITGHADERGSTEYNLALGQRRAQAVKDFYTTSGLDASRFEVVSLGEERPLASGSTEEAWAQNRRAEFTITGGDSSLNP